MRKIFLLVLITSTIGFFGCKDDDDGEILPDPKIEFIFSPEEPMEGETVNFTAEAQSGSSQIITWEWDFGFNSESIANTRVATYNYSEAGTYTVQLTGTDVTGKSVNVSKDITVAELPEEAFPAEIIWSFSTETTVDSNNDGASAPAIAEDGTIYYLESFAKANSKLVAVTDQGNAAEKKWEAALGFDLRNAPTIGPDNNIYIAAWAVDAMFKINAQDGSVIWNQATATGISNSTAAVDTEGNTYVGSRAEGVFSWDKDGNLRWQHDKGVGSGKPYYSSPALSKDQSTLYILMTGGELYALNTSDGTPKWIEPITVSDGLGTSISIDADGTIYFTTGSEVVAVTDGGQIGTIKWSYEAEGANTSGVVIGPNGNLYAGSEAGLISLKPDGSVNWVYDAFINESVPAVDNNGNIYVGSADGKLHIVNPDGEKLIDLDLGDNLVHSPTITTGSVYVEAMDNSKVKLYKIAVEDVEPAASAWPMKGQNEKNDGRAK